VADGDLARARRRYRRLLADRRLRFLGVGGFNVVQGVVWFAFFHALLGHRVPYLVTLGLAYVPAILIGFYLYRVLVFKVRGLIITDFTRFVLVQVAALGLNAVILPFFHEVLDFSLVSAQCLSVVVIVVFNYSAHLYFSFRRSQGHPAPSMDPVPLVEAAPNGKSR
jgi:putative flippase GtrA